MRRITRALMLCLISGLAILLAACGGGRGDDQGGSGGNTQNPVTPTVNVTPASPGITSLDPLQVTVSVSGASGTPTGSIIVTSGSYSSASATLSGGSATITIPASTLAPGTNTLRASYTPDSASSSTYRGAAGTTTVMVTLLTPTVSVSPAADSVNNTQPLSVSVTVSGASGGPTPTGSVTLTAGTYVSSATQLNKGSATILIAAGSLATGSDTLKASYTPDAGSSNIYAGNTGVASVAVTALATPVVTVNPALESLSTAQSLNVSVKVTASSGMPSGSVVLSSGAYTSAPATLTSGSATINIPPYTLAPGTNTLNASYTPDNASSSAYQSAAGTATVTVSRLTPIVNVSPAADSVNNTQPLSVSVTVSGASGGPTPTGSVTLTAGTYASAAMQLNKGNAAILIPPDSLEPGTNTLRASYAPDAASSNMYAGNAGVATVTVTALIKPTIVVNPASMGLSTAQSLNVSVRVTSGNGMPSGSVVLSSGAYTSAPATLTSGTAAISIPPYSLVYGSDLLSAAYTPDAQSANLYSTATGSATVSVARATPAVTVTPASSNINSAQSLGVAITVSGGTGVPNASGTVSLSGGGYSSPSPVTLSGGNASVSIPAGALAAGNDTFTATYTPDHASASFFNASSGTSGAVIVVPMSTITVNQSTAIAPVTDQLMGMNLAAWYDDVANASSINAAFGKAGIKAIRWPGGSWSDAWHWRTSATNLLPSLCYTRGSSAGWGGYSSFSDFVNAVPKAGQYDLALTANYGSNATCDGGGDPAEAAEWAGEALQEGYPASHMTVGNENYGSWEFDLHAKQFDPTTYAQSVIDYAGNAGFYSSIKAASPTTEVGVVVDAGGVQPNWDSTVLRIAKGSYDFVEYHYYPQNPGNENDTYLVHQAAPDFTKSIKTLKSELATALTPDTPIYVGELGSVSGAPGKQSWSITQGLYAGQILGEMMNQGISRATWWIGFGNCDEDEKGNLLGNMSPSLYGWQKFGAYNVFSDGPTDGPCGPGSGAIGTMNPTAQAFNLFQNLAVDGEYALSTTFDGDATNIRGYAATHGGGTALFLFNLNEGQSQPVKIILSGGTVSSSDVKVITYDKAIYDQTNSATPVWADPITTDLGAQSLPLTLTLTPWSMNVVILK